MDVTIIKPRLDIPFKEGPVPPERGPISPIRQHWENFVNKLHHWHQAYGDQARIVEMPAWQMTQERVFDLATQSTIIYLPHRQKFQYKIDNGMYYMQTVFPEFFTIDKNGWGAHMSTIPFDLTNVEPNEQLWTKLQERIENNVSKFEQPGSRQINSEGYWLFICQIPHDEVIKQSSNISVADALRATLELADKRRKRVLVKGHPVNPDAMRELYSITTGESASALWLESEITIHTLLKNCEAAFMVNSGVGFEAMLHEKPIVTFGDSEYKNVVNQFDGENTHINMDVNQYKKFMTAFFERLAYSGDKDGEFFNSISNGFALGRDQIYGRP